ncbi:MAG TPA: phosphotransferase family protein [Mycobacteriales bacterium]|nr:phosphotransferase family protein [Mycobacteriales bacterium]
MALELELERWLGGEVNGLRRLLGGASRETWAFELDGRPLVLRRDPAGAPRGGAMRREAALLRSAGAAGVPVADVVHADDTSMVMSWLDGETIARRILRDDAYAVARSRLVGQLAEALARLHRGVAPGDVDGLPEPADVLADLREMLAGFGEAHPALELGLRRLDESRPAPTARVVVHGDFRLGNLMVDDTGLVGVLDWELAHVGDAAEDLGWLCVRSWRFGSPLPVAGVGDRAELLTAYVAAGGPDVDEKTLDWWEAYGTLRWAVICAQQAATHLSGAVRSVELAVIGRRICEVELDLLDLLVGPQPVVDLPLRRGTEDEGGPHDRPTASELLTATREWLAGVELTGRDAFLARVVDRALATVDREIGLGPVLAERHRARLDAIGYASDAELAAGIRNGDHRQAVVDAVRDAVIDKLRVADPRQLTDR